MSFQRTLKKAVTVTGIGLHSGREASLTIHPARPNSGIVFKRSDVISGPISAHYKNVVNTTMATTLGRGPFTISTVEHVLATIYGLKVDNALIEVSGPEVPIMDGSAQPFVEAILAVGIDTQLQARSYLQLLKKVEVKLDGKWAVAKPSSRLEVHGSIDWDHPAIGFQEFHYVEGKTNFSELAAARTFGFLKDVEALKRIGLARGGSLENAVVVDESKVLNPDGLRFTNEFARHKVLDALGDFRLAGIPIQAEFRLHRAGHDLHSRLVTEIFRDAANFEVIDNAAVAEERRYERAQAALSARSRRLAVV